MQAGDDVPDVTMYGSSPKDGIKLKEHVGNKTVVIFGVPGAFTPGCSKARPSHPPPSSCCRAMKLAP